MILQLVPRILPFFMNNDAPGLKAKFDDPNYLQEGEQMFRDKFSEYLQVNKNKWKNKLYTKQILLDGGGHY